MGTAIFKTARPPFQILRRELLISFIVHASHSIVGFTQVALGRLVRLRRFREFAHRPLTADLGPFHMERPQGSAPGDGSHPGAGE